MSAVFPGAPAFFAAACRLVGAAARLTKGLEVRGLEHLPRSGPVLVAGNHVSLIDGPLVGAVIGRARMPSFMVKREMFAFPPMAWTLRRLGGIPIDRGARGGDLKALRATLGALKAGGCLVVFPEGTRSRDGRPLKPKSGVGLLARLSGAPVVPVRAVNTESAFSGERPFRLSFGPALTAPRDPQDARAADQAFAEAVMNRIFEL